MTAEPLTIAISTSARRRIDRATEWLGARPSAEELLIIGPTRLAADALARRSLPSTGASFGWHRLSLAQLAAAIAGPQLALLGLAPLGPLGQAAMATRLVHRLRAEERLGHFEAIGTTPGLPRGIASAFSEMRSGGVLAADLQGVAPDLATALAAYEGDLADTYLTDWSGLMAAAVEAVRARDGVTALAGRPVLLLDTPVETEVELALVAAIVEAAPSSFATMPARDTASLRRLTTRLPTRIEALDRTTDARYETGALNNVQRRLFDEDASAPGAVSPEDVEVFSAPGEGLECVEIARRALRLARAGTPFDRIAVLLRSTSTYRAHVEEAFARAGIPAYFARGAERPDPAGRAFLALLRCAAEGLSAARFAEYLSLGQVPDAAPDGGPPQAIAAGERWTPSDPAGQQEGPSLRVQAPGEEEAGSAKSHPDAPVREGQLRAPRRWEKLLVEAAVIGGRERWERRLAGLEGELRSRLRTSIDVEDDAHEQATLRSIDDLAAFKGFALPLVGELDELPRSASWGTWLDRLGALASRSLQRPESVLATLAELAPLNPIGPVQSDDVLQTLAPVLTATTAPCDDPVHGRVFVAPIETARGMSFEAVFVPGLAEKMFPARIVEDPILPDAVRARLPGALPTNQDRVERERLALSIAAGAAERRICFSYPRLDVQQGRARIPSFYALEIVRAAEGRLPDFAELAERAESDVEARMGWPAPSDPADAIDAAEYDLASLARLADGARVGAARYLLGANPHLARALRARYQRWSPRWTPADGLVERSPLVEGVMALNSLGRRPYSPTALQQYAACPYRFLLGAIHRLVPDEVPAGIEQLDPVQRGSLIHDTQFGILGRLHDEDLLPLDPAGLDRSQQVLDDVLAETAARYRDDLAPAIPRVWDDGVAAIRTDLREWLRRLSEDESGFIPWRFELGFGLDTGARDRADPHSVQTAVDLACGIRLRGSIDLVERHPSGRLRVTDHKTGLAGTGGDRVVSGGTVLQPILYALAAERLFAGHSVDGGRLYFCTSRGQFAERRVPLTGRNRAIADEVAGIVGDAIGSGFLPAAPARGACERCDYRRVCGPNEAARTARKPEARIEGLLALRELP